MQTININTPELQVPAPVSKKARAKAETIKAVEVTQAQYLLKGNGGVDAERTLDQLNLNRAIDKINEDFELNLHRPLLVRAHKGAYSIRPVETTKPEVTRDGSKTIRTTEHSFELAINPRGDDMAMAIFTGLMRIAYHTEDLVNRPFDGNNPAYLNEAVVLKLMKVGMAEADDNLKGKGLKFTAKPDSVAARCIEIIKEIVTGTWAISDKSKGAASSDKPKRKKVECDCKAFGLWISKEINSAIVCPCCGKELTWTFEGEQTVKVKPSDKTSQPTMGTLEALALN